MKTPTYSSLVARKGYDLKSEDELLDIFSNKSKKEVISSTDFSRPITKCKIIKPKNILSPKSTKMSF